MSYRVFYIMGVSGSGKSTIGQKLAGELNCSFYDGDDFHTAANISKMRSGKALTDADRFGWLKTLNELARGKHQKNDVVISCSALKESYRQILQNGIAENCRWIYLKGDFEIIMERMKSRRGHFMPVELLKSQFSTLEELAYGIEIDITKTPEEIIERLIRESKTSKSNIGLIGLGVMGKSLALNMVGKGTSLSLFNRPEPEIGDKIALNFIREHHILSDAKGFDSLKPFIESLEVPRKVFLMIKAGKVVDKVLDEIKPMLQAGDVLIEGGNSHYQDTIRRSKDFEKSGIHFLGTGISGGEEGALKGPSIMPGGPVAGFLLVKEIVETIAAKGINGKPCTAYIGENGAGHFVKMVHNGIEYGEMQIIAEIYSILRKVEGYDPNQIAELFESWITNGHRSYLLEITVKILRTQEGENRLLDSILDKATSKGTGSWTVQTACDLGVSVPTIAAALFARSQSASKQERTTASTFYRINTGSISLEKKILEQAYKAARIINHHQGFHLIDAASVKYGWKIKLSELAQIWTNGCIIQSEMMNEIVGYFKESNRLLLAPDVVLRMKKIIPTLTELISVTTKNQLPVPCLSASLNYFYGYTEEKSSANLIQAQRDFFGAHKVQLTKNPEGKPIHLKWSDTN